MAFTSLKRSSLNSSEAKIRRPLPTLTSSLLASLTTLETALTVSSPTSALDFVMCSPCGFHEQLSCKPLFDACCLPSNSVPHAQLLGNRSHADRR